MIVPLVSTRAVRRSEALVPTSSASTCQAPETTSYVVPGSGAAETNDNPMGSGSSTRTFVAASGPLFAAVMLKVTVSPARGVVLLTLLASAMSAARTVIVALASLLVASGSI